MTSRAVGVARNLQPFGTYNVTPCDISRVDSDIKHSASSETVIDLSNDIANETASENRSLIVKRSLKRLEGKHDTERETRLYLLRRPKSLDLWYSFFTYILFSDVRFAVYQAVSSKNQVCFF